MSSDAARLIRSDEEIRSDTGGVAVSCVGIERSFGGLRALKGVDLEVRRGEIFGLVGPNGSGKTTLVNVMTGFYPPNKGRVRLWGRDITGMAPSAIARQSGVDGLICVGAGAAGHPSQQSGLSLVREIRTFWDGCLVLGGAINDGWQIRAAEALGADLAYVGTRFVASEESGASDDYKAMLINSDASDLVYTDRLSGIGCTFLRPTLERWAIDPDKLPPKQPDLSSLVDSEAKLWRDIWTAGHGIGSIDSIKNVTTIVEDMAASYRAACDLPPSAALAKP